ncbi:hypothetical protein CUZ56_00033 [Saezia sanguinis]|uniref:DUF445 domain-containing protein n=1 Tax=Saezia sanguinis TaxID=1965230 RepID=A0A433SFM0_9BURK|nr:DUF445 domain-containing protein [Saezia sanguinis]RUS67559.1 hypothetical protein CUZ56_00033 [Saezia sanguinis]
MKRTATLMLIAVALLYVLATWMEPRSVVWGYVAAFAEAGTVGAIADWFAVVALFRHPLGIPIPHTAVIPANRERIAKRLADFLCNKFIDTEQIAKHLGIGDPVRIVARWLSQPTNARKVAGQLCKSIEHLVPVLASEQLRTYVKTNVLNAIQSADLTRTGSALLTIIAQEGSHQRILDQAVMQLGKLLTDEEIRDHIASQVATEVRYLRYIGLDAAAGKYATRKIVATVAHLMEEMAQNTEHPFRQRFDHFIRHLIDGLKDSPDYHQRIRTFQQQLAQQPALSQALEQSWDSLIQWIKDDCAKPYPITQNHLEQGIQTIARQLQASDETRQWLNQKIFTLVPQWIARYRSTIRQYIVNTVNAWTPEEMSSGIEKYVGRDLQFIRINGTLVGGLVGLTIHTVTQLLA